MKSIPTPQNKGKIARDYKLQLKTSLGEMEPTNKSDQETYDVWRGGLGLVLEKRVSLIEDKEGEFGVGSLGEKLAK